MGSCCWPPPWQLESGQPRSVITWLPPGLRSRRRLQPVLVTASIIWSGNTDTHSGSFVLSSQEWEAGILQILDTVCSVSSVLAGLADVQVPFFMGTVGKEARSKQGAATTCPVFSPSCPQMLTWLHLFIPNWNPGNTSAVRSHFGDGRSVLASTNLVISFELLPSGQVELRVPGAVLVKRRGEEWPPTANGISDKCSGALFFFLNLWCAECCTEHVKASSSDPDTEKSSLEAGCVFYLGLRGKIPGIFLEHFISHLWTSLSFSWSHLLWLLHSLASHIAFIRAETRTAPSPAYL